MLDLDVFDLDVCALWRKSVATFKFDPTRYVAEAAQLLDERNVDWYRRVDVDSIVMTSMTRCVLGQVYGAYHRGVTALFGDDHVLVLGDPRVYAFSNESPVGAWVREISARLAGAQDAVSDRELVSA